MPEDIHEGEPDGLERKGPESWSMSQQHIVDICTSTLGITAKTIQRAHRIGKFKSNNIRPLIANFA